VLYYHSFQGNARGNFKFLEKISGQVKTMNLTRGVWQGYNIIDFDFLQGAHYGKYVQRQQKLRCEPGADECGEHRDGAQKTASHQGRAGHGKDDARRGCGRGAGQKARHLERQVHDEGTGRPVRLRCGAAFIRQPVRHIRRGRYRKVYQARQAWRGVFRRRAGRAADRRGRQSRPRVPERPSLGARQDGILHS
jgi:hypothetical protein